MNYDHCQVTCTIMHDMQVLQHAGAEKLLEGFTDSVLDILGHPAKRCPIIGQCKD